MRILVTCANGFVGRALCGHLGTLGRVVVSAMRRAFGRADETVIGDIDGATDWTAFVFNSAIKVNGEGRAAAYRETDAAAPEDAYAMSKWKAEQGLQRIALQTGLEVVILRPPLVYAGVKANFLRLLRMVQRLCGSLQVNIKKTRRLLDWCSPLKLDQGLKKAAGEQFS